MNMEGVTHGTIPTIKDCLIHLHFSKRQRSMQLKQQTHLSYMFMMKMKSRYLHTFADHIES